MAPLGRSATPKKRVTPFRPLPPAPGKTDARLTVSHYLKGSGTGVGLTRDSDINIPDLAGP